MNTFFISFCRTNIKVSNENYVSRLNWSSPVLIIFVWFTRFFQMTVCSCHATYAYQTESTLYSCLNVKEPLARSKYKVWSLSDCNWNLTQNHLVRKRTLNHLDKLAKSNLLNQVFVGRTSRVKKTWAFSRKIPSEILWKRRNMLLWLVNWTDCDDISVNTDNVTIKLVHKGKQQPLHWPILPAIKLLN